MSEPHNNRTVTVRIKRGDLISVMLATSLVIKAADRDGIPHDRIQHGYNVLARALMEHDSKEEERDAKKAKRTEN